MLLMAALLVALTLGVAFSNGAKEAGLSIR